MNYEFTVSFETTKIFKSPTCTVLAVSAGGAEIGFISLSLNVTETSVQTVITPFNNRGIMKDSCCTACAAKELFKKHTGFNLKSISIAQTEDNKYPIDPIITALLFSALAAKIKNRGM